MPKYSTSVNVLQRAAAHKTDSSPPIWPLKTRATATDCTGHSGKPSWFVALILANKLSAFSTGGETFHSFSVFSSIAASPSLQILKKTLSFYSTTPERLMNKSFRAAGIWVFPPTHTHTQTYNHKVRPHICPACQQAQLLATASIITAERMRATEVNALCWPRLHFCQWPPLEMNFVISIHHPIQTSAMRKSL